MAEFKLVISDPATALSIQKEVKDKEASTLMGKKIGDSVSGDTLGLEGYEFVITGGSDYCGFPMRKDVQGTGRKKILAVEGVGIKKKGKGIKQRKTVCGNTIHARTAQVNMKVTKKGKEELFVAKKKEEKEEKKEVKEEVKKKPKEKKGKEKKEEQKKEQPQSEEKKGKPKEKATITITEEGK